MSLCVPSRPSMPCTCSLLVTYHQATPTYRANSGLEVISGQWDGKTCELGLLTWNIGTTSDTTTSLKLTQSDIIIEQHHPGNSGWMLYLCSMYFCYRLLITPSSRYRCAENKIYLEAALVHYVCARQASAPIYETRRAESEEEV